MLLLRKLMGYAPIGLILACSTAAAAPVKVPNAKAPVVRATSPDLSSGSKEVGMNVQRMRAIVEDVVGAVQQDANVWNFMFQGAQLTLIYDETHDRMRVISPIVRLPDVTTEQLAAAMGANFHSALDARYASSGDVLYAAFIHPLSHLQEDELRSALHQVAQLATSFGTSYSSGELMFGR